MPTHPCVCSPCVTCRGHAWGHRVSLGPDLLQLMPLSCFFSTCGLQFRHFAPSQHFGRRFCSCAGIYLYFLTHFVHSCSLQATFHLIYSCKRSVFLSLCWEVLHRYECNSKRLSGSFERTCRSGALCCFVLYPLFLPCLLSSAHIWEHHETPH